MRVVASLFPTREADSATETDLVLARVRLRLRLRTAWLRHLEAIVGDSTGASIGLDDLDSPQDEAAWMDSTPEARLAVEELEAIAQALDEVHDSRFAQLQTLLGLSNAEVDLLQLLFAVEVEPRLAVALASLHPSGRPFPTTGIAARLFDHGRANVLTTDSPLRAWELVHVGEPVAGEHPALCCDAFVREWLQGAATMDGQLARHVREIAVRPRLRDWPEVLSGVARSRSRGQAVRTILSGPPGVGRRTLAAIALAEVGVRAFAVDASRVADAEWPRFFMLCQRFAVLQQAGLVWVGGPLDRAWPANTPTALLQFVACREGEHVVPARDVVDHRFELHAPSVDESLELWRSMLPESQVWSADSVRRLATVHRLTVGEIFEIARHAPTSAEQAETVARELGRGRLGELAQFVSSPFGWEDLVVPPRLRDALQAFAFEATDRASFWETHGAKRLFPRGTGLVGLMVGPPGTGKTMATQVIAAELGLDLYRIDLAAVVSKYIGETAKNLRQIFQRADRLNAVLLFDEADAMFGKRTELKDAHDRHANADTNYLLQMIEEYRGVALLASNKRANIDPAFIRRVRYLFSFPRPDAAERTEIWRRVLGELVPDSTSQVDHALARLGTCVALSGAEIKNAVLAAVFVARRRRASLTLDDLLVGVDLELGKEGKSLTLDDRKAVMRGG